MDLKRPAEISQATGSAAVLRLAIFPWPRGRLQQRFLGAIEIAEQADQRGEDAA